VKNDDRALAGPSVVTIAGAAARRRITTVLEAGGFRVVGNGRSPEEAASATGESPPAAVVVAEDLRRDARVDIQDVRRRFHHSKIVVLATHPTPLELREALAVGVDGVVLDDEVERCLAPAVRAVCSGQIVVPGNLRPAFLKPALSTREKQALAMVVMGFTNGEIARKLHVTESTVKSHLSFAYKKLGVRSRTQATQVILDPEHGLGRGILALSDDLEPHG
jgi:DNA-binding NarL/FixJ family response regulator